MSRPRGFIENWSPSDRVGELVGTVYEIIQANRDILPLTLRQIFYMLVSGHDYEKTEQAYKRLCEAMNKARRAHMIDMNAIRDDGFSSKEPSFFASEDNFYENIEYWADDFELDRQEGQDTRIMLWCEAAGMMPQLAAAAGQYHVPVYSSGGFDSLTAKHDMAKKIANMGDVEILHIGDHDPSGVHICSSLGEDLEAFLEYYGGYLTVTRLAVTPDQVRDMGLPTAPPKSTDKRSFVGRTTQAEAIPPRTLRQIVQDAITDRMDLDIYQDVIDREEEIKEDLQKFVAEMKARR